MQAHAIDVEKATDWRVSALGVSGLLDRVQRSSAQGCRRAEDDRTKPPTGARPVRAATLGLSGGCEVSGGTRMWHGFSSAALAGQDLTARDLICVKPRRYNLALSMLHCNIASGQAMCAREAWLVPAARFQREFLNHVTMMAKLRGAADCVEVGAMILDGPRRVLVSSTLVIKTDRGQQNSDRDLLANGVGALTCGCG
jgi:hypothetical protein